MADLILTLAGVIVSAALGLAGWIVVVALALSAALGLLMVGIGWGQRAHQRITGAGPYGRVDERTLERLRRERQEVGA